MNPPKTAPKLTASSLEVSGVPETQEVCASTPGLRDVCIDKVDERLRAKLDAALAAFAKSRGSAVYQAKFEVVKFSDVSAAGTGAAKDAQPHIDLAFDWKLAVRDENGGLVASPSGTTRGPKSIATPADAEAAVTAILDALLADLDRSLKSAPPPAPAAPPEAP